MITTGKEIYSLLISSEDVTDLVGDKIYPLIIPEGTSLPCVVYQRNYENKYTKDGLGTSDSNIDISVIALDYEEAINISNAVFNTLSGASNDTVKDIRLVSGNEVYAEGAFIQNMMFYVMSV